MIYVIMCGGYYGSFAQPKALTVVNGEALVDRTILTMNVLKDTAWKYYIIIILLNGTRKTEKK